MRWLSNAAEHRVMLVHLTYGNTRNLKKITTVIKSEKKRGAVCVRVRCRDDDLHSIDWFKYLDLILYLD